MTLSHCNLQMAESAAESCSSKQVCYTSIKKRGLDTSFLALGLQRRTTIRDLSQQGVRLYGLGPQRPQSQMAFEPTLHVLHLAFLAAIF